MAPKFLMVICRCLRHPCRLGRSRHRSYLGQRTGLAWRLGWAPRLLLARRQVGLGSRLGLALGLGLESPGLGLGPRLGLARELGSSGLGLGSWLGLDLALGRAVAGTSQLAFGAVAVMQW